MVESKTVTVISVNGLNYISHLESAMPDGSDELWNIVNGSECLPHPAKADRYVKFVAKRDRMLAIIVLSVELSLLYLIGDPKDSIVLQNLADQFQKKTWANVLELRCRLHSLQLKNGDSVH